MIMNIHTNNNAQKTLHEEMAHRVPKILCEWVVVNYIE